MRQDNCYALEIDTKEAIERSNKETREKVNLFLKFANITSNTEEFLESATMNPVFEESAMLQEGRGRPAHRLPAGLQRPHDPRQGALTDEELTAFFFVTLPEALPIAVITRFMNWLYEFGIPVGSVIVNGLIQK